MNIKICKTCKVEKELILFPRCKIKSGEYYYYPNCKECCQSARKKIVDEYYQKNSDKILIKSRERYQQNIDREHKRNKNYKNNNKESIKKYRNNLMKQKRQNDPSFKIKSNISRAIRRVLKKNGTSKNGLSFIKYMNYSIEELRKHIEKQFEPWMTWNNWGIYNIKTWDENNSASWNWQLDHIIPQCKLQYLTMDDANFKLCWSLDNLRPLSAKQNFLNGIELLRGYK